jgi:hypothetical protein
MMEQKTEQIETVLDAVETLSSIIDLDIGADKLGVSFSESLTIIGETIEVQYVHWLGHENSDEALGLLKSSYKKILQYLRQFYRNYTEDHTNLSTLEGINNLMSLVGEASQRLQRCTNIFKGVQSRLVESLKEYRELKKFYSEKIFKLTKTGYSWEQLMLISEESALKHDSLRVLPKRSRSDVEEMIVDLESVKDDRDYELLYLQKEDGTQFFDRELVKNIRLVCEFGQYFEKFHGNDPLIHVKLWQEKTLQLTAKVILNSIKGELHLFYKEYKRFKEIELVSILNRGLMALMLSGNPKNLLRNSPVKCCFQYFTDFHYFLHQALVSRDYQKLIAYPPNDSQMFLKNLVKLVHSICCHLFTHIQGLQELVGMTTHLLELGFPKGYDVESQLSKTISTQLKESYKAINNLLEKHPNGPLFKVLDVFSDREEAQEINFNLISQKNYPYKLYDFYLEDNEVSVLYLPSPTSQEYINHAEVLEEFKGFLRSYAVDAVEKKHLMFNLQDRTSWKEFARCQAIDELQLRAEHSLNLDVITLPKNTEFYHQLHPYYHLNDSESFIEQFLFHLQDDKTGFFFPRNLKNIFTADVFEQILRGIQNVFFNNSSRLRRIERLDFIEITYLLIQLKAIQEIVPDSLSFTCKDSLDLGAMSNVMLFSLFKYLQNKDLTDKEHDLMQAMLFTPALIIRERNIHKEQFDRLNSVLQTIEGVSVDQNLKKSFKSAFGGVFNDLILKAVLRLPNLSKTFLIS